MIFKQWKQVLNGTKTQTRRPVKEHEEANRWDVETDVINEVIATYPKGKWGSWQSVYVVGKTYAVQPGRGKKAVGRIRITKISKRKLLEIVPSQIVAEGIRLEDGATIEDHIVAFANLWDSIYKKPCRWKDNPEVWVLEFELVGATICAN